MSFACSSPAGGMLFGVSGLLLLLLWILYINFQTFNWMISLANLSAALATLRYGHHLALRPSPCADSHHPALCVDIPPPNLHLTQRPQYRRLACPRPPMCQHRLSAHACAGGLPASAPLHSAGPRTLPHSDHAAPPAVPGCRPPRPNKAARGRWAEGQQVTWAAAEAAVA